MDAPRRFSFEPGSRLYSISRTATALTGPSDSLPGYKSPHEELYYTTPEEAILSIFHVRPDNWTVTGLAYGTFQLQVCSVTKSFEVVDNAPPAMQELVSQGNNAEQHFKMGLRKLCPPDNRAGFYVQVPIILRATQNAKGDMDKIVGKRGHLTAFVLCLANSLILLRNLDLDISLITNIMNLARERRQSRSSMGFKELSETIKATLAQKGNDYLDLNPIDVTPMSQQSMDALVSTPVTDLATAEMSGIDTFSTLSSDLIRYMALGYSLDSINRFCRTSYRFNEAD